MKNKSYIGIAFVVLVFGIWAVPKIVDRVQDRDVIETERLDIGRKSGNATGELLKIGPAPKFSLVNQDSVRITSADYKGKVHVLEFFFTTCPTICPIMNRNMLELEKAYFGNPNFGIVSITINPEHDTPSVLKEHAKSLGVRSSNWNFLTGQRDAIFDLANKGFNLYAGRNENVNGGFEHSGYFALIDKNGFIRCRTDAYDNPILYYDGTESAGVEAIMADIKILLDE